MVAVGDVAPGVDFVPGGNSGGMAAFAARHDSPARHTSRFKC